MSACQESNGHKWGGVQVERSHYFNDGYLSEARFRALHAQFHACLAVENATSILEIGIGPGLLEALLRNFDFDVFTYDLASDLRPSVVGRLPALPFSNSSFDLVCAFEVLEHIPIELLNECMKAMRRVAKKRVIISVPSQAELHNGMLGVTFQIGRRTLDVKLWRNKLRRLTNPDEHYWELEYGGITVDSIKQAGQDHGLELVSDYFVRPWFHMFIFDTRKDRSGFVSLSK
jgi:SAM-dependent methyltransferase